MIRRPPRSTLFPLHDALPISNGVAIAPSADARINSSSDQPNRNAGSRPKPSRTRSEEHTSELQSQSNLVCRLLLEKKKRDRPSTVLICVGCAQALGQCTCHTH